MWRRQDPKSQKLVDARPETVDDFATWVKTVHQSPPSTKSTPSTRSTPSTFPEIAANGALTLINVACSLLDRQIAAQAEAFLKEGGFTERLYHTRRRFRG